MVEARWSTKRSNDASFTVNPIYFVPGKGGESETRKPFSGWAPNGDATGDL